MKWRAITSPAFLVAMAIFVLGAAGLKAAIVATGAQLRKLPIEAPGGLKFNSIPREVPGWARVGVDAIISAEEVETLGTQNYVSRVYVQSPSAGGRPIAFELHCAYYTGTIDTVPHVPERCYVGGGMSFDGQSLIVPIPLDLERFPPDRALDPAVHGGVIRTARTREHLYVHLPRGVENLRMNVTPFLDQRGAKRFAGYFFIANGGLAPTANDVRLLSFKMRDTYSYYAKVQFSSGDVGSPQELAQVAASFLNEALPAIMQCTPDWAEVVEGRYPPDRADSGRAGGREKTTHAAPGAQGPAPVNEDTARPA